MLGQVEYYFDSISKVNWYNQKYFQLQCTKMLVMNYSNFLLDTRKRLSSKLSLQFLSFALTARNTGYTAAVAQ